MCIWQVVQLPHSGASLLHLWCVPGPSLLHLWCISGPSLLHLWCVSGPLLMHLPCISVASLVLVPHSGNLKQFVLLALLCSFAAPLSIGCTLSLKPALLLSLTFSSSSFAKTLLILSDMMLVDSSAAQAGRQAGSR